MDNLITIGEYALLIRRKEGLSQTELGKLAGVSRNTISAFERGEAPNITIGTISNIFKALGAKFEVSVMELPKHTEEIER